MVITSLKATLPNGNSANPPAPTDDLPNDLRVELGLEVEKYYHYNILDKPIMYQRYAPGHGSSYFDDILGDIAWTYVPGAQEYELEYVYWDDEGDIPTIMDEVFANAVRINTWKNWHDMALTYPSGRIYFRVRGVGRHTQGVNNNYTHRLVGAWSTVRIIFIIPGLPTSFPLPFETDKSWQFTTSFAEE